MRGKQWDLSSGTKPCPKCGGIKPLSEFGQSKYTSNGFSVYCRDCMAAAARERRATPEGKRAHYESTLKWIANLPDAERAEGLKTCPKCGVQKPFDQYPKNKRNKHGIGTYCCTCSAEIVREHRATPEGQKAHRAASKRWREENRDRHADNHAKWLYGIEHGTYADMLAKQNGRCAICGTDEPGNGVRRFHIDHCHSSKKVRGLLCDQCNRGLGIFRDSVKLLSSAIDYLLSSEGR